MFVLCEVLGATKCVEVQPRDTAGNAPTAGDVKLALHAAVGLPVEDLVVVGRDGLPVCDTHALARGGDVPEIVRVHTRLLGGKGGFGSLLKGAATNYGFERRSKPNFGACRDLHGRRVRHVEQEKSLVEFQRARRDRDDELKTMMDKHQQRQAARKRKRNVPEPLPPRPPPPREVSAEELEKDSESARSSVLSSVQRVLSSKEEGGANKDKDKDQGLDELWGLDEELLGLVDEDQGEGEKGEGEGEEDEEDNADNGPASKKHKAKRAANEQPSNANKDDGNKDDDEEDDEEEAKEEEAAPKGDDPLSQASTAHDLTSLGLERLKEELLSRGLKCGGSLQQRAERLFAVKGLQPHDFPKTLLAKK